MQYAQCNLYVSLDVVLFDVVLTFRISLYFYVSHCVVQLLRVRSLVGSGGRKQADVQMPSGNL